MLFKNTSLNLALFHFLSVKDLHRFRRVNKSTKHLVDRIMPQLGDFLKLPGNNYLDLTLSQIKTCFNHYAKYPLTCVPYTFISKKYKTKLLPNEFYFACTPGGLEYEVIDPCNTLQKAMIPWEKLSDFPAKVRTKILGQGSVPTARGRQLLELTAKAGHTKYNYRTGHLQMGDKAKIKIAFHKDYIVNLGTRVASLLNLSERPDSAGKSDQDRLNESIIIYLYTSCLEELTFLYNQVSTYFEKKERNLPIIVLGMTEKFFKSAQRNDINSLFNGKIAAIQSVNSSMTEPFGVPQCPYPYFAPFITGNPIEWIILRSIVTYKEYLQNEHKAIQAYHFGVGEAVAERKMSANWTK